MNLQKMMQQAQAMQKKIETLKEEAAAQEYTASAGAGAVEVTVTGAGEARKVTVDPSLLSVDEKEVLEDLLVAAFNNAKKNADDATGDAMQNAMGGLGLPAGFKLPF